MSEPERFPCCPHCPVWPQHSDARLHTKPCSLCAVASENSCPVDDAGLSQNVTSTKGSSRAAGDLA